jgi:hypothetical protein
MNKLSQVFRSQIAIIREVWSFIFVIQVKANFRTIVGLIALRGTRGLAFARF